MHYKTKTVYGVATIIFLTLFAVAGIVLLRDGVTAQKTTSAVTTQSNVINNTTNDTSLSTSASSNSATITATGVTSAQLASHNTGDNCWIVIDGKVYDVSNYSHPKTDPFACGTDNTSGWNSVGKHTTSLLSLVTYMGIYSN